jgi:L-galactose dehydrogenase/L-glyceraldehyde 3-phosphate reductase
MEVRSFGRTGLRVSALGLGGGAVGGLMVRGSPADQERAVGRAVEAGITFIDTAPMYGDGASETNLGRVLATLRPAITLATKVMLRREEHGAIAAAVPRSVEASLRRLRRDSVDLLQLHNPISTRPQAESIPPHRVLDEVLPAFTRLRDEGKCRFIGITGLGETTDVGRVVDSGSFDSAQVAYNLLNPSAAADLPAGFPGQDFGRLIERAGRSGMATVGIRAVAGGALSASSLRHPIGATDVAPIGTGADYEADVDRAQAFLPLLAEYGASDLVTLALRFAIAPGGPSTVLIGVSTLEQLDHAIAAVQLGPLPRSIWASLHPIWAYLAGGSGVGTPVMGA